MGGAQEGVFPRSPERHRGVTAQHEVGKEGRSAWKLCGELPSASTLTHIARGVATTQAQKMSHLFPEKCLPPETEPEGMFQLRNHTPWQTKTTPGRMMGEHPAQGGEDNRREFLGVDNKSLFQFTGLVNNKQDNEHLSQSPAISTASSLSRPRCHLPQEVTPDCSSSRDAWGPSGPTENIVSQFILP